MKSKSYRLTLLEVMVALLLLSAVMGALFQFFKQMLTQSIQAKSLKQHILTLELYQHRLNALLSSLSKQERSPLFWLEEFPGATGPALHFYFQREADHNPAFTGTLEGHLFLNSSHELSFSYQGKGSQIRNEVLLEKIASFSFTFFDSAAAEWKPVLSEKEKEHINMLKIDIHFQDDVKTPYQTVFFLSDPTEHIIYPKKGIT
jgi:type II secretory pathway component PulJ